jgi:dienelactone hydrolase
MSGGEDDLAPPADSTAVVEAALAGGVAVEQLLVPGQGHAWTGPTASLAAATLAGELADRLAG